MSLHLRLVVDPVVVCDVELFASDEAGDDAPPQLNGGAGTVVDPAVEEELGFGFALPNTVTIPGRTLAQDVASRRRD